jgi:hypothetical protein
MAQSSPNDSKPDPNGIYFYSPSLGAAILFTIFYSITFVHHFYLTVIAPRRSGKYQHAGYFIPLLIGAGFEIFGYATRCASIEQTDSSPLYAVSQTLVVVSPVLVCASMYLVIGRLIRRESSNNSDRKNRILGVSARWLPHLSIFSDVFSFLLQGSGSGIASSGNWEGTTSKIGIDVVIVGLALQVATFAFFLLITALFHRRLLGNRKSHQQPGHISHGEPIRDNDGAMEELDIGVFVVIKGIYISGVFILVSSSFCSFFFDVSFSPYHLFCSVRSNSNNGLIVE